MNRIGTLSMVAFAAVVVSTSCGEPQQVHGNGTVGANAEVGDVVLRNVFVRAPGDGAYQRGEDAVVRLAMFSRSDRPDALLGVRTRSADQVELRSDTDCDGTAETVPRVAVPADRAVDRPGSVDPAYQLHVVDFSEEVRAGTTVPLTFIFEDAGEITVDALVETEDDGDMPPTHCPTTTWSQ
ncbi:copper(I)-binding protein [Saccharothrix carnea]|uniref:Copper(I)-binding protein n=1 Tax=Saccharothrix carnea TaxID=1280637 RepID=A0A2P8IG16_SACCR|nr:copper chaperone PCu(A)C [Saccharothrix carnea]PSL57394.1 copper(I)-binding protein [Saccharothrix carnea]